MDSKKKTKRRKRIKLRIRKIINGSSQRPRLSVFRSLSHFYAQVINDQAGVTIVSSSSLEKDAIKDSDKKKKAEVSFEIGKRLAEKARAAGIESVVFDRNGYAYHGRVKKFADGAREGGLVF